MRERLIELLGKADKAGVEYIDELDHTPELEEVYAYIADYLLENGVIVPPCWIGDKIYFVCGYNLAEYTVERAEYDLLFWQFHCENPAYVIEHREFSFFDERIGKTVFLTREEAEQALQEREK